MHALYYRCSAQTRPRYGMGLQRICSLAIPTTQTTQLLEMLYLAQLVPPFRDEPHAEAIA